MSPSTAPRLTRGVLALALACACGAAGPVPARGLQPPRFTRDQMEAALAQAPPFLFVYGTRDPAATALLRRRAVALATRAFGLDSSRVVADRDADERRLAAGPVYLVGGARENAWTERLAPALPVRFEAGAFSWQGRRYAEPLDAIHLSWPNPLEPRWFLIVSAGNTPAALAPRAGWSFGDEDWRILRAGELVRSGRFAHGAGGPWRYDPARDRDREAERERHARSLRVRETRGLRLLAAPGTPGLEAAERDAAALLARIERLGLPGGGSPVTLTLYRSLEEKGLHTRDTRPEHLSAAAGAPAVHAALPAGRDALDLWSVAAARLVLGGASGDSRFLKPAAVHLGGRFEGEPLEQSLARLARARRLPSAAETAARPRGWASPLVRVPARALLVRALFELAPPRARGTALLAWLSPSPPGTLDSLCLGTGVTPSTLAARYGALADSLARAGAALAARSPRAAWRPAQGFQRGVCLEHAVGLERGYLSAECARQLRAVRAAGADWVSLTPFAWLADPGSPELGNSTEQGPDGESDEALAEAAARARALGLRVWLHPHVWTRGWSGEISFTAAGWERFHDRWAELVLHWAILAEREGLDGLFVGHELASSTARDPARWRALIADVRRVFRGALSYSANWDEVARVPFWDALDVIGVSLYAPLAERPSRDPRVLRRGAARALAELEKVARRHGRPLLVAELGYPPSATAAVQPWEEPAAASDPEAQRACFEAMLGALDPCLWVAGVFVWKWGSGDAARDPYDVRGRPAEAVIAAALRGWQGRPVQPPARTPAGARAGRPEAAER
jgi:hypothetical protein